MDSADLNINSKRAACPSITQIHLFSSSTRRAFNVICFAHVKLCKQTSYHNILLKMISHKDNKEDLQDGMICESRRSFF